MAKSSAKYVSVSAQTPKTFNKDGNARANATRRLSTGQIKVSDMKKSKRMGAAMAVARGRGTSANTRSGR